MTTLVVDTPPGSNNNGSSTTNGAFHGNTSASKLQSQCPASGVHRRLGRQCSKPVVIVVCLLLAIVIVLQLVIIGLISNSCRAKNSRAAELLVREQNGQAPSELAVRGEMLQLADLLSWDAKCNRILHDLVVSCYGAPDYLAEEGGSNAGSGFQVKRKFPHILEPQKRRRQKPRRMRPLGRESRTSQEPSLSKDLPPSANDSGLTET